MIEFELPASNIVPGRYVSLIDGPRCPKCFGIIQPIYGPGAEDVCCVTWGGVQMTLIRKGTHDQP